jgi:hypothetical protein
LDVDCGVLDIVLEPLNYQFAPMPFTNAAVGAKDVLPTARAAAFAATAPCIDGRFVNMRFP